MYVRQDGILIVRSDFAGTQVSSKVALGSGWHTIELCGSIGTAGTWSLYRDGVKVVDRWTANAGTANIVRIQIGDTAVGKTWTGNLDDEAEAGDGLAGLGHRRDAPRCAR